MKTMGTPMASVKLQMLTLSPGGREYAVAVL